MKYRTLILASVSSLAITANASAADLTPKRAAAVAPSYVSGPFYAFGEAGIAWTSQQNDLIIPGLTVQGTPKEYPTGGLIGGGFGIQAPQSQIGFIGAEFTFQFDSTRASTGCGPAGLGCQGYSKNSGRFAQEILWSPFPTMGQAIGKLPANAHPSHWAVPITVPDSWLSSVMFIPKVGVAEHNIDLCATNVIADAVMGASSTICDTRWLVGLTAGLQVRVALSGQLDLRLNYNFDWYNTSINSANSPIFGASTFHAQNQQAATVGVNYHF